MEECVYLIGCRAVGKSSIGVELAQTLGYEFLDTDALVTEKLGCSVSDSVNREGWQKFRKLEEEILLQLTKRKFCVVATGGGAILHRDAWMRLKKQGQVVWLTADLKTLCDRISGDKNSEALRPSLTGNNICQELEGVLAERTPLYRETADVLVDTDKMTVSEAVEHIEKSLLL
jgi:shikimate kinase